MTTVQESTGQQGQQATPPYRLCGATGIGED
jgi:hypothetical protein